jgi:inosine triphosphate pyrophosphatase
MAPKQINFITGNKNKLIESKAILGDTVDLQSQSLHLVEIQGTIEEISADKCRRAAEAVSIFNSTYFSPDLLFLGQWSCTC